MLFDLKCVAFLRQETAQRAALHGVAISDYAIVGELVLGMK